MNAPLQRLSTGIPGLDEITHGGLVPGRSYLICGGPGTGKTTIGLQFLAAGGGERGLFISLEEQEARIRQNAALRRIGLENVEILDVSPSSEFFAEVQTYDIFTPAEVEREPVTAKIVDRVKALAPCRIFLDSVTQFRYFTTDSFQFRRQVLSFLRFLSEQGCTVMYSSEGSSIQPDDDLQFMSDGVIVIDQNIHGRSIAIRKTRGSDFRAGAHTLKLSEAGAEVFPRLQATTQKVGFSFDLVPSGIPGIDEMLNGGIERGTITILTGPSGTGKTTLGLQFAMEAARRGERSVIYSFEEEEAMMLRRCEGIGMPARETIGRGTLQIRKIEPLQYSFDEFARIVREDVERSGTNIVMLDSVAGFTLSLRGEDLRNRLHALGKYLQNLGVVVLIINEIEEITGEFRATEVGISYLADNVIFLRFMEVGGELRKAIGVLKKRLSNYERLLREFAITPEGIRVGAALTNLRGILRGTPETSGEPRKG